MSLVTQVTWAERTSGDVGCLHGTGVISDPIMEGERLAGESLDGTLWSHCFVVSNDRILEAVFPKISLSPWNVYDGQETVLFRINVDSVLKQSSLLEVIQEYVGKGYDVTGCVVGMAGLEIMRALHLRESNNLFADKHKAWCSELATIYIQKLVKDPDKPDSVDPQQVYNYLRRLCNAPSVIEG